MRDDMDTQFAKISEGEHVFEIFEVSQKVNTPKSHYRTWKLNTFENGGIKQIWVNLFPWQAKELLLALGYMEEEYINEETGIKSKKIIWDDEEVIRKKVSAVLSYEKDKDSGKEYPRLNMFRQVTDDNKSNEEIPF